MSTDNPLLIERRHCLAAFAAAWACPARAADELFRPWPRAQATPVLELPTEDGAVWRLAAQKGKPVLLNFWASWCEPCRSEMPALELVATRHEAQGLQVMAVNFRETDAAVRRFIEASSLSLPVLRDRDGGAAKAFGVRTFPTTVAIDRQGRVLSSAVGECDWSSPPARQWVAALL
jgi:thiol-disulfide isomerase/thioredoxin